MFIIRRQRTGIIITTIIIILIITIKLKIIATLRAINMNIIDNNSNDHSY